MEKKRYQVTFSGSLVGGLNKKDILNKLCALFNKDAARIRALFHGTDAVIAECDSQERAVKYVDAIRRAGALCEVREHILPPTDACKAPEDATGTDPSGPPAVEPEGPNTIEPQAGPTDITASPLSCSRIGGDKNGLVTNRMGREAIAFHRLSLISVFKSSDSQDEIKLLFLTHGDKRPLLIDASAISFTEFPDVVDSNLVSSLRRFLNFLHRKNPALLVDPGTAQFMAGEGPFTFKKDPTSLVSDLYRGLTKS